jgi:hypothetical protein
MSRTVLVVLSAVLLLGITAGPVSATTPGAPGIGDPYFPLDGNGGYDVRNYRLDIRYDPVTDVLQGRATITATATQHLSRFNLDLDGALAVASVTVDGRSATVTRKGDELTVRPRRSISRTALFVVVVDYGGIPQTLPDGSGFIHTDDGALVVGQPHVADTWFPANDHPVDRASYEFRITVPSGLEVAANGRLDGTATRGGWTTWRWEARDPMTTYLAGMAIGELAIDRYQADGIRYWDAIDPDLLPRTAPVDGEQYAYSGVADLTYKRLTRVLDVPSSGAPTLTFQVNRDTESSWDHFFVEARTPGADDWTTLPDQNGATLPDTGSSCPIWLDMHPFLHHYQTPVAEPADEEPLCLPQGSVGDPPGEWHAATGASEGWETWAVDLSAWAGGSVEVSLTYASDDVVQGNGVFLDDVVTPTGAGSTSFEDDADPTDGWAVPGAPEGSEPNANDWFVATADDAPPSIGEIARAALARQPEITEFLEGILGPYPFGQSGGIVDDEPLGFALENQTRPIYGTVFFTDSVSADLVVVHELAHQWVGNDVTIERWQHIWLNEGWATYMEWLWSEREGLGTVQENFDFWYSIFTDVPEFWQVPIGDPGPELLFDFAVYIRGAMTLHELRLEIGDQDFFRLARRWTQVNSGQLVTTDEFIRLAERVSGEQLDDLFETWLFSPEQPSIGSTAELREAPSGASLEMHRLRVMDAHRRR